MLSLPDFKEKQIVICNAIDGQKLAVQNDNLIIKNQEDEIILQCTCFKIFSVWIIGGISMTSVLIERSKKFGFSIKLLSYSHKLLASINACSEGNFLLREKQYSYTKMELATWLVKNKIGNQVQLLKSVRIKTENIKNAIEILTQQYKALEEANDVNVLLGIEGLCSKVFFGSWYEELGWRKRSPRTKIDEINVLLDIGYTYLFNFIECFLHLYGFDVYKGVYHKGFYLRKSLVCDMVEPFRCIIDKKIRQGFNLGEFKKEHFERNKNQYYLKIEHNKEYIKKIFSEILINKEEIFVYLQTYYRCFMREKQIETYPIFTIIKGL